MRKVRDFAAFSPIFALAALVAPANATTFAFSGTEMNVDAPGPQSARCGARFTVNIGNGPNSTATGVSNFGSFATTQSHCILLPPPVAYDLGEFRFDFASGDSLFGTYSGTLTLNAPGVFNVLQNNVVTGGTGLFAGASGMFTGTGLVSFLGASPSSQQSFAGTLNLSAVPEPGSWTMMIVGLGIAGAAMRRRGLMHFVATPLSSTA